MALIGYILINAALLGVAGGVAKATGTPWILFGSAAILAVTLWIVLAAARRRHGR